MVLVLHDNSKIISIQCSENSEVSRALIGCEIIEGFRQIVRLFPKLTTIVWCNIVYKPYLDLQAIQEITITSNTIFSYNPVKKDSFERMMGYVDLSMPIQKDAENKYPTWMLSAAVGAAKIELLELALHSVATNSDFDYFLKSFAKLAQIKGVFCYALPTLLKGFVIENEGVTKQDLFKIFRFTKQHFKFTWVLVLYVALLFREKRFFHFSFLKALFYKRRNFKSFVTIEGLRANDAIDLTKESIDVLIPTIGREKYLYDVLCDLNNQSVVPTKVVVIEQNPEIDSVSKLHFVNDGTWKFELIHIFTHQAGACNARNLGLQQISSKWVFFADDDIRLQSNFIKKALQNMIAIQCGAATFKCVTTNSDYKDTKKPFQWGGFGAGSSIVCKKAIDNCRFGLGFEFGFGEDGDFGMQIRNNGFDILFFETPTIHHLKAPIGGFRSKPSVEWSNEIVQPKPSPTVMLFRIKNCSIEQNWTYKLKLGISYYPLQSIKNPIRYYKMFQKQWKVSNKWATILMRKDEV